MELNKAELQAKLKEEEQNSSSLNQIKETLRKSSEKLKKLKKVKKQLKENAYEVTLKQLEQECAYKTLLIKRKMTSQSDWKIMRIQTQKIKNLNKAINYQKIKTTSQSRKYVIQTIIIKFKFLNLKIKYLNSQIKFLKLKIKMLNLRIKFKNQKQS